MAVFMIDHKRFVFEKFDREMVLINLEDGLYYSVSDTGTEILQLLEQGLAVAEILEVLSARYFSEDDLASLVKGFVAELERQAIIVSRPTGFPTDVLRAAKTVANNRAESRYAPPVITRFDDMQEILQLDPIHQVNEQGWPNR
jgi:hypothetical protein